ncbi:MAG: HEAT repeat domain-containing protein [Asgard group archaeon]|nr:HEAT repeat domain-containing protein [Asgard group archaeon]
MSKSINTLTRQLRDLNTETRCKAAQNLSEMGAEEAVPTLISVFETDQSEKVRSIIAESLVAFGHFDEVIAALIKAKNNDADETVKVSAEWALGQIAKNRGFTSIQALIDELNSKD